MKTTTKNSGKVKDELPSQSAIDENPLAKPSLNLKEAKRENNQRKQKKVEQKESEWKI